jgi:hypothetical protein
MRCVAAPAVAMSLARAVVVDAISDQAARFYHQFGFHQLDGTCPWRRIGDSERSLGA